MSNSESDGSQPGEWDERGELAWNEFDWERYLREQDEAIAKYRQLYETCRRNPDRIDEVAEKMGWSCESADDSDDDDDDEEEDDDDLDDGEIYTLHKNPIFVSTNAIFSSVQDSWEKLAVDARRVSQELGVGLLAALHRAEEQSLQAVYALDFGDYAMAVSLFKRALFALNAALALLNSVALTQSRAAVAWREDSLPRLFDLREIWLRVMNECRSELDRPVDEEP